MRSRRRQCYRCHRMVPRCEMDLVRKGKQGQLVLMCDPCSRWTFRIDVLHAWIAETAERM